MVKLNNSCIKCKKLRDCKIEQLLARFEETWIGDVTVGEVINMNPVKDSLASNCSWYEEEKK